MRKCKQKYSYCGRIISIVILMSFLTTPMFGQQLTELSETSSEGETIYFTDSEVESLIDDISVAAKEAIEQAGADAAKAAALAALERQAELLQEKAEAERSAELWKVEAETIKANSRKNVVIGVIAGLLSGLALGITGTLLMSN